MTKLFIGLIAIAIFATDALADPLEKCQSRNTSYSIGDDLFCDKYFECGTSGKLTDRVCDDGFVYSLSINQCDYPHNVDCSKRPQQEPSKSTDPSCPRMNGFYAFPAAESCQKFYHCLEGTAYEKTCPEGIIFDDTKGACVHPDMAGREECSASKVLNFICPNADKRFSKLRFGDHDRFPHPSDCRKYFICTRDGQPRIGGCPLGKVFNPKTGTCDQPKRVPNCVDYYGKKAPPKLVEGDDVAEDSSEEANEALAELEQAAAEDKHPEVSNSAKLLKRPNVPAKQAL